MSYFVSFILVVKLSNFFFNDTATTEIYTINYDPLLDRALLDLQTEIVRRVFRRKRYVLADEFSGLALDSGPMILAPGTVAVTAITRRAEPYVRGKAVDLIHLHGGQHWFKPASGVVYKAALNEI